MQGNTKSNTQNKEIVRENTYNNNNNNNNNTYNNNSQNYPQ